MAFEPSPRNIDFLRRHLELSASDNVTVVEAAVSTFDGTSRFDVSGDPSTGHLAAAGSLTVQTMTVHSFVQVYRDRLLHILALAQQQ